MPGSNVSPYFKISFFNTSIFAWLLIVLSSEYPYSFNKYSENSIGVKSSNLNVLLLATIIFSVDKIDVIIPSWNLFPMQSTDTVLMIEPAAFGFSAETA